MKEQRANWLGPTLLVFLLLVLIAILWPPNFYQQGYHRRSAIARACLNNLKMMGLAMEMYADAWGDRRLALHTTDQRAPEGEGWPDLLMPYLTKIAPYADAEGLMKVFRCPDSARDRLDYSLNRRTSGMEVMKIRYPSTTIAVFDSVNDSPANNNLNGDSIWRPSDGGVPPVGSLPLWPEKQPFFGPKLPTWAKPRHSSRTNVLWVDGHVSPMRLDFPSESPDHAPRFDPAKPIRF